MVKVFRAKSIVSLMGESPARTRSALEAPLSALDDGVLVADKGRILAVESFAAFRRGPHSLCPVTDLGEVRIAPGLVNAHCHLELSHLAGAVPGGIGFAPWVRSLVAQASRPVLPDILVESILAVLLEQVVGSGTVHVGDVGSRNPALVAQAAEQICGVTHFLEVLGSDRPALAGRVPEELAAQGYCPEAAADLTPDRHPWCAVSGHALYSTDPKGLLAAFAWCRERRRPFSMHLAECAEEDDCLLHGKGDLYDMLHGRLLPPDWRHPGLRPVEYAESLGLLAPNTLAVHCVRCSPADVAILARTRASVCLCPRSNRFIGVGLAPADLMAEQGVLLCLGTDSLASNQDIDMRREMKTAEDCWGFSDRAVLRMATINAAHTLGLEHLGTLAPGKAAVFSVHSES